MLFITIPSVYNSIRENGWDGIAMSDDKPRQLMTPALWRLVLLQQVILIGLRLALGGLGIAMRTWAWLGRMFLGARLMVY